jgi:hypothetical protein
MSKFGVVALLGALIALAGCGGGSEPPSSANAAKADSLLITLDELPKGSKTVEALPELCGPIPVFEREGGQSALSSSFVVGSARLVEAVGVFKTPTQAEAAYEGLNERNRLECIGNAINSLSAASAVEVARPKAIDFGEDGTLVRYRALDDNAEIKGYSDVISIRDGRCAASLLLAAESGDASESDFEAAAEMAADPLSGACG